MKRYFSSLLTAVAVAGLMILSAGCGQSEQPKEITTGDIPTESQNLFAKAAPELKELATKAVAALQAQDWPAAWVAFQTMGERKDLTPEQRQFVASSIMTVGAEMQKASAQGDERAQAIQQLHSISK
jgi:hypothetical protein